MEKGLKSYVAGADLTDKVYYAVKLDGNVDTITGNAKVVLAGAGEKALGILYQDGALKFYTGDVVGVATFGTVYAIAGGTVDEGSELAVDANGKLVVATAGQYVVAVADQAGAAGNRIRVELKTYVKPAA